MARRENGIFQVSNTEMQTYKECKRRWFLQYYMGLDRRYRAPKVALDTGTTVHDALHQFYQLGGVTNYDESVEKAMDYLGVRRDQALAQDVSQEDLDTLKEVFVLSEILTKGYFEWLIETGADDHWKVEGSEERLVVPGPLPDTEIKGFVDLWGTHEPSGDLLVVDTKVVGSIDDTLGTLHLNEQGPLYAILLQMIDNQPGRGFRVIWNMIKRNKRTARAKPPFYQRYELALNKDQLAQFYAQLHGQISDMLETERRLDNGEHHFMVAYPTPTRDCSWKCPFLSICGAMNDPRTDVEWIIANTYTTREERHAEKE